MLATVTVPAPRSPVSFDWPPVFAAADHCFQQQTQLVRELVDAGCTALRIFGVKRSAYPLLPSNLTVFRPTPPSRSQVFAALRGYERLREAHLKAALKTTKAINRLLIGGATPDLKAFADYQERIRRQVLPLEFPARAVADLLTMNGLYTRSLSSLGTSPSLSRQDQILVALELARLRGRGPFCDAMLALVVSLEGFDPDSDNVAESN